MKYLDDASIAVKGYLPFIVMFVFVVITSGGLIYKLKQTDTLYSDLGNQEATAAVEAMRIGGTLQYIGRQMNNVLLVQHPPQGLDELDGSVKEKFSAVDESLRKIAATGHATATVDLLKSKLPALQATAAATFAMKRSGDPDQDAKSRAVWGGQDGRPLAVTLFDETSRTADAEVKSFDDTSNRYTAENDRTCVVATVAVAVGLLLSGFLTYLISGAGIARPVRALQAAMRRLADQDFTAEIPGTHRRDEVGGMAQALQVFKDNGLAMQRLTAQAAEERRTREAAEAKVAADREASAAQLAEVVEGLAGGLGKLAQGDLTFTLAKQFAGEYERLRSDFNQAVSGLQMVMRDIGGHAQAISNGTGEIATASADLAKRTEQQAANLGQTAAALDQITATVGQTASGSAHAQTVAADAKREAEHSAGVVGNAVAAMGEIEASARQIGQIIGVIDEIAFQTNLLALNAGVEAARAGEAGRGFAVVASEVRALAQRAADAAKEIKTLISTSMQQVERGVRLVGETGEALRRIQAGVTEINAAINEIAASAREQASGLAEVNTAVNQMDKVTQQNAAMVEESTTATHSLSQETEALTQAMARFRLGNTPPVSRHRPAPARPVIVAGNTALKADGENWDSF